MNKLAHNNQVHEQTVEIPNPLEIHPSVSPLAAELLMKVCEIIGREPGRYNQQQAISRCGSPCCIIGHIDLLSPGSNGLTDKQYKRLFFFSQWPEALKEGAIARFRADHEIKFISEYVTAQEGIARIEHFLRTGE